ncbi:MAG: hypothetical protein NTV80_19270 [Verrucomicrobia bacterium]|nr:hypothetical protein [Verrucomicrobiota bacterium]
MKQSFIHLILVVFSSLSLQAQVPEKWTLTDGRSFEGQVKSVTPGMVIFARSAGPDAPLEISKLSEASQRRLIEVLGLAPPPPPAAITPAPTVAPVTPPAPAVAAKNTAARNPGAIDATDLAMIDSKFGLRSIVIGKISNIATLGSTGHKKVSFQNSEFYLFINKRVLEANPEWKPDALTGKMIQAEGEIARYQDQLQIQISTPTQIGMIEP